MARPRGRWQGQPPQNHGPSRGASSSVFSVAASALTAAAADDGTSTSWFSRIGPGLYGGGGLVRRRVSTGEQTASIGFHVNTSPGEPPTIRLYYTTTRRGEDQGERLDYTVGLTTTPLPWGGVRWWFVCPLVVSGRAYSAAMLACGADVGVRMPRFAWTPNRLWKENRA